MSLKAYDGMITRKGFTYLQEKVRENYDKFYQASRTHLIQKYYVPALILYFDHNRSFFDKSVRIDRQLEPEMEDLKKYVSEGKTSFIRTLLGIQKILQESTFINDTTVHLHMTIEDIGNDKLLVYPNILVNEHKKILWEFLDDWYAQNQSDPDERVPETEWEERCNDWYKFNEFAGMKTTMTLFDPDHYWNNMVARIEQDDLDKLIDDIVAAIPSEEERRKKKVQHKLIDEEIAKLVEGDSAPTTRLFTIYDKARKLVTEERIKKYIEENEVIIQPITKDVLKSNYITINQNGNK
jgi:hypothetical protein